MSFPHCPLSLLSPSQARGEAVELKLKVLDDKLIRAQVSEEEKLKPLHDNVSNVTENLYAERLAREVYSFILHFKYQQRRHMPPLSLAL